MPIDLATPLLVRFTVFSRATSRDRAIAVYGRSKNVVCLALELQVWSRDLLVCTDGGWLSPAHVQRLERHGIPLRRERIARLLIKEGIPP